MRSLIRHRPLRYVVVGGWNTFFGVGLFTVLYLAFRGRIGYVAILAVTQVIAVLQSHLTQRLLVWRSRGHYVSELLRFSALYVVYYFANLGLLKTGVEVLGFPVLPTQWALTLLLILPMYLAQRSWAFRLEPTA